MSVSFDYIRLVRRAVLRVPPASSVVTMMHYEDTGLKETPGDTSETEPEATLSIYLSLLGSESIPVISPEHTSIFLGLKSTHTSSAKRGSQVTWFMRDTVEWDFHCDAEWYRKFRVTHCLGSGIESLNLPLASRRYQNVRWPRWITSSKT